MLELFLPPGHVPAAEVRQAVAGDLKFLDSLQKKFAHQLGYLPIAAIEKRVVKGDVWIGFENGQPAGYLLGVSPYRQRADLGIIYQSAIEYDAQRKSIATQLVEAWVLHQHARHPELKQIVCWCAQDIAANLFWESLDFLALGWRAGSEKKQRVHIYWNRPLDPALADLWIPDATASGLLRGPRDVHLFEPGQDWQDRIRPDWSAISASLVEVKAAADRKKEERHAAAAARHQAAAAKDAEVLAVMRAAFGKPPPGFGVMIVGGAPKLVPLKSS